MNGQLDVKNNIKKGSSTLLFSHKIWLSYMSSWVYNMVAWCRNKCARFFFTIERSYDIPAVNAELHDFLQFEYYNITTYMYVLVLRDFFLHF